MPANVFATGQSGQQIAAGQRAPHRRRGQKLCLHTKQHRTLFLSGPVRSKVHNKVIAYVYKMDWEQSFVGEACSWQFNFNQFPLNPFFFFLFCLIFHARKGRGRRTMLLRPFIVLLLLLLRGRQLLSNSSLFSPFWGLRTLLPLGKEEASFYRECLLECQNEFLCIAPEG